MSRSEPPFSLDVCGVVIILKRYVQLRRKAEGVGEDEGRSRTLRGRV